MTTEKLFIIQLGDDRREYRAMETNAPLRYDGFGTLELYSTKPGSYDDWDKQNDHRVILIEKEHWDWQCGRNGSGGYWTKDFDWLDTEDTARRLRLKLMPGGEA